MSSKNFTKDKNSLCKVKFVVSDKTVHDHSILFKSPRLCVKWTLRENRHSSHTAAVWKCCFEIALLCCLVDKVRVMSITIHTSLNWINFLSEESETYCPRNERTSSVPSDFHDCHELF